MCIAPFLFNLFLNKVPKLFDKECDPVFINNEPLNVLMWADDLFVVSKSIHGLSTGIDRISKHFKHLGLDINTSKTKIMVFNNRGLKLDTPEHSFYINDTRLEVVDEYKYLGFILKPSGSISYGMNSLLDKASRAWFSISNLVYCNKQMPYNRAVQLFSSLVTPIALYASEYWFPFSLTKKSLGSKESLMHSWEQFKAECLQQKFCRLFLSVMKKTSRLAVLGELGQYPTWCKALELSLKYEWSIFSKIRDESILSAAITEMTDMSKSGIDCWVYRIEKVKSLINLQHIPTFLKPATVSKKISSKVKGIFDRFWIDSINKIEKNGCTCPRDHNKLRTYKQFKGSFTCEPYIDLVCNRNQRSFLSRFRVGSHRLRVETGRWTFPKIDFEDRTCLYCDSGVIDNELHFITQCKLTECNRNSFYSILSKFDGSFFLLNDADKLKYILCPIDSVRAKLSNKYLSLLVKTRTYIDQCKPIGDIPTISLGMNGIELQ